MEYDPVRYLDLLEDYTSRETARVRRNLGVLSFVVVMVQLLDVPIDELQFQGMPITRGHELIVTSIAAALLVYWGVLFAVRYWGDAGRRKERANVVADVIGPARERHNELSERASQSSLGEALRREHRSWGRLLRAYDAQHTRTGWTRRWLALGRLIEWLPTAVVAAAAAIVLSIRLAALVSSL